MSCTPTGNWIRAKATASVVCRQSARRIPVDSVRAALLPQTPMSNQFFSKSTYRYPPSLFKTLQNAKPHLACSMPRRLKPRRGMTETWAIRIFQVASTIGACDVVLRGGSLPPRRRRFGTRTTMMSTRACQTTMSWADCSRVACRGSSGTICPR